MQSPRRQINALLCERTENSLSARRCVFLVHHLKGAAVRVWSARESCILCRVYMRVCAEPLSCRAHLDRSSYAVYFPHAQQKSSPVSHRSVELENITLGLHSVRQIQPRLMLYIYSIPGRASFCALDASRACFFFYIPILTRTARSVDAPWSFIYLPASKWVNTRFALRMFILYCFALQARREFNYFSCLCADKLKVNRKTGEGCKRGKRVHHQSLRFWCKFMICGKGILLYAGINKWNRLYSEK